MSYRKFVPRAEEFNPPAIHLLDIQINQQLHGIPHILTLLRIKVNLLSLLIFYFIEKGGDRIIKENGQHHVNRMVVSKM